MTYREGISHHPTSSSLILLESKDAGETWEEVQRFELNLEDDGKVWNCPRLSYVNSDKKSDPLLNIICDAKSGTREAISRFSTYRFTSYDGENFHRTSLPFTGMVPDKMVKFQDKYFCANHKIKSRDNKLIQLVNWDKKIGEDVWYDCNIVANDPKQQYCEASLVNVDDKYLVAYLRDNSGHVRPVYYTKSKDGLKWDKPNRLKGIFGQRVTAIRDDDMIIGAYRNTEDIRLSLFYHPVGKERKVKIFDIDQESRYNLYHFGYTGITKTSPNAYIVSYYIKNKAKNPFIKIAFLERS